MISKIAKKAAVATTESKPSTSATAMSRIQKDIDCLEGLLAEVRIPNRDNLLNIDVTYSPKFGVWNGGTFHFALRFPEDYPYCPPRVFYLGPNRIFHPNIEGDEGKVEWGVCISILRADWKPTMGLRDVVLGIEILFAEPNIDDPLPGVAKEAAQLLKNDEHRFIQKTQAWMRGRYIQ